MNNKKVLAALILALIVLLVGASVLYTRLSAATTPDQLSTQTPQAQESSASNNAAASGSSAGKTPDEAAGDNNSVGETNMAPQSEADNSATDESDKDSAANAGSAQDSSQEPAEPAKSLVPDFTVYDADGNEVHLSDFFGKPIVLNFWASWCGPCKMEMPDFHEKYLELGDKVQFLMVNMTSGRETLEGAKAFINDSGYTFPVLYDTAGSAAYTYSAYTLPTTYFIDADGHGVAYAQGAIDGETLQIGLDMIR